MTTTDEERALCEAYADRIRAYGLRHLRDVAAAEDLVQHVLLAVLQALREGRVQDQDRIGAYVHGTCRNAVRDLRRREAQHRRLAEAVAVTELPAGFEPRWSRLDRRRLEDCLRALEARARAIVLATYVEDQDAEAIAADLAVTPGNVRVIRHRTLARLQACVEAAHG